MKGRRLLACATTLLAAACTATTGGRGAVSDAPAAPSSRSTGSSCSTYAAPDPNRPRMKLQFTISADHSRADGTEEISFTPDKPINELVFRLTANTQPTVEEGNSIEVTSASADHGGGSFHFTQANADASTQGGLLHIPFGATIPAGTTVTARIAFRLTLAGDGFDRFGRPGSFVYFGSGEPLLAWERGFGWHTEPLLDFTAESATSEAMRVDLTVTAPAKDVVIMSGDPVTPPATAGSTRTWHSTIDGARDLSIAAGPFAVSDTTVDGVRLRIGTPSRETVEAFALEFQRAIQDLAKRFGPFPFPSLSVARLPGRGGAVEYPAAIQMLDDTRRTAVHETAHQWFYAMVGNSQALHPWLDEAFATYAEQLVDRDREDPSTLQHPGPVDASAESYGRDVTGYFFTTYDKGAAALWAARDAAGPAAWDGAIRCYVARNAWRIANPPDVKAALAQLPAAIKVLQQAGALR